MQNNYIVRNPLGATVTIMVPWDCDNGCAFCVNKSEYADGFDINHSMNKILESIKVMDEITPRCDFVITGGEPFADCRHLEQIVEAIPDTHFIFINTTLPILHKSEIYDFIKEYSHRITCINVSRHIWTPVDGANDKFLKKIGEYTPIRINSVIRDGVRASRKVQAQIEDFMERFSAYNIQFRADYRDVTLNDIDGFRTHPNYILLTNSGFEYVDHSMEINRVNVKLNHEGHEVHWHLTTDFSRISCYDGFELVDIIMNQDGYLMDDWNDYGFLLDLDAYKKAVRDS